MGGIIRFLLSGLAVLFTAYILPGVSVTNYGYALLVAAVISLANVIVKPILILLTSPITVLTLGLFLLAINALIILMVDYFVPGFYVVVCFLIYRRKKARSEETNSPAVQ
jgi:putative membrane protein